MTKSRRKMDEKLNKVAESAFNYIYNSQKLNFKRCTDKLKQKQGCDLTFFFKDKEFIVDEKCATQYFDRNLETYAFELSFNLCDPKTQTRTDKRVVGWLLNENNITQFYSIGYINAKSLKDFLNYNITSFECFIISKEKLKKEILNRINFNSFEELEEWFEKRIKYKQNKEKTLKCSEKIAKGIKIVQSGQLAECPTNIVISKEIIKEISIFHKTYFCPNIAQYADIK